MATVHVTLSRVKGRASTGSTMPVQDSVEISADTMTSSGTSAQSSITAPDLDCFWSVTVTGGNVYVKFGANPTAVADAGYLLLDGDTRDFSPCAVSEKLAIKDA
jgi:hypothetical protein